jgi:hypothetical protein
MSSLVILVLVFGVGTAVMLSRTSLVEIVARQQLAARGLTDVDFVVASLDLSGARLEKLRVGEHIRADAVDLAYTASGLAEGRVDRVVVHGLDIDASDIGALRALLGEAGDSDRSAPPVDLPAIRVSGARLHGKTPGVAFTVRLDGDLRPDRSGAFTVVVEEAHGQADGQMIAITGLSTEVTVAAGGNRIAARFGDGTIETSVLAPLTVAGTAAFDGGIARFAATATGREDRLRLTAAGHYDVTTEEGGTVVALAPISLGTDGLYPGDVAPFLGSLGMVAGRFSGQADIRLKGGVLAGTAGARGSGIEVRTDGGVFSDISIGLGVTTDDGNTIVFDLDQGAGQAEIDGETFVLTDIEGNGTAVVSDSALQVRLNRATAAHAGEAPWFASIGLDGSIEISGSAMTFGAAAATADDAVRVTVKGDHDIENGRGRARMAVAPMTVEESGIDLAAMIPAMAQTTVGGGLAANTDVTWNDREWSATAAIDILDGAWAREDMSVRDAAARLLLTRETSGDVVATANGLGGELQAAGQVLRLSGGKITATMKKGGGLAVDISGATVADGGPSPWVTPLAVDGQGRLDGTRARFDIRLSHGGEAIVVIDGRHDVASAEGGADVHLGPLAFVPGGPQPANLAPPLAVIKAVGGSVAGDAKIGWADDTVDGTVLLRFEDLSFSTDTATVEGLSGTIGLDGLDPPTATAARTLRARRIVGVVPIEAPLLRFRVDGVDGGRLLIDHAEAGLAGGLISVDDAAIATGGTENRLVIALQGVELEQLLALFALDGVAGSGSVSGRVPLIVDADRVRIEDALLAADGDGVLRFRSDAARRVLDAGGEQAQLLLNVLEDFRYQVLSLSITETDGGAVIGLRTEGNNPAVRDGHPFVLNVNLSGNLDRVLGVVLVGYRLSDRAIRATVGGRR